MIEMLTTNKQDMVLVPALIENGNVIIPEFYLSKKIYNRSDEKGRLLTALEYQTFNPPTLAELCHAYSCPATTAFYESFQTYYDENDIERVVEEWTSTFVKPRQPKRGEVIPEGYKPITIINRPEKVFLDPEHGWIIEYVPRTAFDSQEPPYGWILEHDRVTGYPIRTTDNCFDENKIQYLEYFNRWKDCNDLGIALRNGKEIKLWQGEKEIYPLSITVVKPNQWLRDIGARVYQRSEPNTTIQELKVELRRIDERYKTFEKVPEILTYILYAIEKLNQNIGSGSYSQTLVRLLESIDSKLDSLVELNKGLIENTQNLSYEGLVEAIGAVESAVDDAASNIQSTLDSGIQVFSD